LENTELIEHFSHQLAAKAGINLAKTRTIKISKDRDLLLSERFDRTAEGRRIHFASAMSLLGFDDGAGSSTGNGFLDIVDFILRGCTNVRQNLRELYRRVAFNGDFLPNVHFSFEVIRQRKLGKTMIEEVHFIVKTIKV